MDEKFTIDITYAREKLFDAIVERAAARIQERIEDDISKETIKRVTTAIDAEIIDIVRTILDTQFNPVDSFGKPTGENTTVRKIIAEKSEKFLTETVDPSGRVTSDHYISKIPRANYIIGEIYKAEFNNVVKQQINELLKQSKEKVQLSIAKQVVEILSKQINLGK